MLPSIQQQLKTTTDSKYLTKIGKRYDSKDIELKTDRKFSVSSVTGQYSVFTQWRCVLWLNDTCTSYSKSV